MMFTKGKIADRFLHDNHKGFVLKDFANLGLLSNIAFIIVLLIILASVLAPVLAPYDPYKIFTARLAPCSEFLFGTDDKGRDVLSRILYGGQYSLIIGLGSTSYALVIGAIIGSIAAVSRKWISQLVMRILDVFMSFPGIALAAIFVLTFGNSLLSITLSIGVLYIPQIARIVRANIVKEYNQDYARAVFVSGARAPWILFKHVARNCLAPILVFTILLIADAIIFEASLSFISAGIPEPTPTWGNILADARNGALAGRWWQAFFPGLAIMLCVLSFNILAEGITDALASPINKATVNVNSIDNSEDINKKLTNNSVEQIEKLTKLLDYRLSQLRIAEQARNDRKSADFTKKQILKVNNLNIKFERHGDVNVVENVTFAVREGQTMGLVGESGCGKSITSLAVMGLLGSKAKVSGSINYMGKQLLNLSEKEMNNLRGQDIAMIYQDALSSLNPSMLIKTQLKQLISRGGTRSAEELLELVGLDPKRTLDSYPHELSGGQRQRVLIAMALTRDPKLIIADEPTTALDVTVQKQVVNLLIKLQNKLGFAMVFVSHDLALVAQVANFITVMYAGQVVEVGSVKEIMSNPLHEYTRGLLGSVVSIEAGGDCLTHIPGAVPSPAEFPRGDRFRPRSSHPDAISDCNPVLKQYKDLPHYYLELPDLEMKRLGLTTIKDKYE